jgi:DNA polymerase I-like protein with 3'-5' exonuclease and polymerase domains
MARIINTAITMPDELPDQWTLDQCYNGTDVLATRMALDAMLPQMDQHTEATYEFSKALQSPALEMSLRGVLVDRHRLAEVIDDFYDKIDFLERNLSRIVLEGVGLPGFNWRSPDDRQCLFYDRLGLPQFKNKGRLTTDRAAREKMEQYTVAKPIITHMNAIADLAEKIKKLKTKVDPDGRIRTTYNIAGTSTGRFSSSFSAFGTGGNLQNVEESLRSIFIADRGMKWCKVDAKQIQSRIVGAIEWKLFQDGTYLDACESSDLHTLVAKLVWPELAWTGDPKADKAIAETIFWRHFTRRDLCKKIGHGSNFEGQPQTLSEQTGVPVSLIIAFQPNYFCAFPAHHEWHHWVETQIRTVGHIIGITGRKRWFFGRRNDPDVVRQAVAYDPQASESFIVNSGMLNIWWKQTADVMMHEHDGLVYQYPEAAEDDVVPKLLKQLEVTVDIGHERTLVVPYEAKVGWNRGAWDARSNPEGLKEYTGRDTRKRGAEVGILDRVIRRAHG